MKTTIVTDFTFKVIDNLIDRVIDHDYSYQFSDDMECYRKGKISEDRIKEMIYSLVTLYDIQPKGLLEDLLHNRSEQYTNGLTHKTIRGWFDFNI